MTIFHSAYVCVRARVRERERARARGNSSMRECWCGRWCGYVCACTCECVYTHIWVNVSSIATSCWTLRTHNCQCPIFLHACICVPVCGRVCVCVWVCSRVYYVCVSEIVHKVIDINTNTYVSRLNFVFFFLNVSGSCVLSKTLRKKLSWIKKRLLLRGLQPTKVNSPPSPSPPSNPHQQRALYFHNRTLISAKEPYTSCM